MIHLFFGALLRQNFRCGRMSCFRTYLTGAQGFATTLPVRSITPVLTIRGLLTDELPKSKYELDPASTPKGYRLDKSK